MSSYDNQAANYDMGTNTGIMDKAFVASIDGILKASELVLNLVVFICATVWSDFVDKYGGGWVQFVSMSAFCLTIILYVLYIFQIVPKLTKLMPPKMPWDFSEMIFNVVYVVFYLIAAIVSSVYGGKDASIGASAFFCYCAMIAYGIDAFRCFQRHRNAAPPVVMTEASPPTATASPTETVESPGY